MLIEEAKVAFFESSPPWMFSLVSNGLWKISPNRETVFTVPRSYGWLVYHEGFVLKVPCKKTIQSLSIERPYQAYVDVKEGDRVVDAGACVGEDTVHLSKEVGERGRVRSIEAEPTNLKYLHQNLKMNNIDNVTVDPYAVWSKRDTLEFHKAERPTDGSVFENHHPDSDKTGEKVEVEAYPLDDMVGDTNVDFLRMNVEGAEIEALKGAKKTLEKCCKVFVTTDHFVEGEYTTERVIQILEDYGFDAQLPEPKEKRYIVGRK